MVKILVILILIMMIIYSFVLFTDVNRTRYKMKNEKGSYVFYILSSIIIMFFGTFGVSDTALSVFAYKTKKCVDDKVLPGTLIVSAILPVGAMAIAFLSSIEVDTITLFLCILAQTLGALIGVRLIVKLDEHMIRLIMGVALIGAACLILFKLFFFGFEGGNKIALDYYQFPVVFIAFFIFGGLNMIGMGATVPNMAVLLLMGIDSRVVFPIVMAGNIISCCLGGFKFVKEGQYTRKAAVASIFGVSGVILAVRYVKNINIEILQISMVALLFYCAFSMFHAQYMKKEKPYKKRLN